MATVPPRHIRPGKRRQAGNLRDRVADYRASLPAQASASRRLRDAGLRVTSARVVALRLAAKVAAAEGRLTPRGLYETARRHGYPFGITTFHHVLRCLESAGLLPCAPTFPARPVRRRAHAVRATATKPHDGH